MSMLAWRSCRDFISFTPGACMDSVQRMSEILPEVFCGLQAMVGGWVYVPKSECDESCMILLYDNTIVPKA